MAIKINPIYADAYSNKVNDINIFVGAALQQL